MREKHTTYLSSIPDTFFPVERFQNYIHLGTEKTFAKGSTVVMPGEATKSLIYVVSGKLRINKVIDDGRERLVYFAGQHGLLGRMHDTCNIIYVLALEDSKVCIFSKEQLKEVFRQDEELIFDVLTNYLTKTSYYMKQAAEIDYFYPSVRVARLLYDLYLTNGTQAGDFYEIDTDLSLTGISEITGAHYVTVSKVLGHLKKQNILEKQKYKIIIYDLEKLKELTQTTRIF